MSMSNPETKRSPMNNRLYDSLKFLALIFLPALATLYFALATLWNLPSAEEVVGTITALDAFLGVLLGLSSSAYHNGDARYDGSIDVTQQGDTKLFSLSLNSDPEELQLKKDVVFKVNTE